MSDITVKKTPDYIIKAIRKYESKPDVKERRNARRRERYQQNKEEICKKARERYKLRKNKAKEEA